MIRVTVEMWPGGDETRAYPLGHLNIINSGQHPEHPRLGSYITRFFDKTGHRMRQRETPVVDWPRTKLHVFYLVAEALRLAGFIGRA